MSQYVATMQMEMHPRSHPKGSNPNNQPSHQKNSRNNSANHSDIEDSTSTPNSPHPSSLPPPTRPYHSKTNSIYSLDGIMDTIKTKSNDSQVKQKGTNDSQLQLQLQLQPQPQQSLPETETYLFPDCRTLMSMCSKCLAHTTVKLRGYEIYIVEQWACERRLSSVILSYTGDSEHQVEMVSVQLPKDKSLLADNFKSLFREIEESGAKPTETDNGILYITNLSSFPSNLNLLLVSHGSALTVWEYFKVNVNLRRLNCLGRSALILSPPTDASEDKFRQIYKIDSKVDIMYAVHELVTLIQIALVDCKLHDPHFVDGLLCCVTEKNIFTWWTNIGSKWYTQPKDGTLGPSTVAAMIGFILSCSFRLDIAGSDFPKEPFNYVNFRVNVGKFQKQYGLEQSWYLDQPTLEKLFKVTCKIPTSDISKLKKVVKNRVNDISRRADYNFMAGDVITLDLEKAVKYFHYSARLEYLWFGKGDVRDLKKFDYRFEDDLVLSSSNAYSLRSSVGKIKKIPKKLTEDYNPASSKKFRRSKLMQNLEDEEQVDAQSSSATPDPNFASETCVVSSPMAPVTDPTTSEDPVCISVTEEFTRNLHRRNSFPFIPSELNIPQLKYENHTSKLHTFSPAIRLKRSKSLSVVESSLLRYETITSTPIKLIQILKVINMKLSAQSETQSNYMKARSEYEDSINQIASRSLKLNLRMKPLFYNADIQFQANERLNFKLEDMEHLGSRLEYEMRVLGNTVRDTREGINVFKAKMDVLEGLLDERCKEGSVGEDRWFGFIWSGDFWKCIEEQFKTVSKSLGFNQRNKKEIVKLENDDPEGNSTDASSDECLIQDDSDSLNSSDNNSNDETQRLKVDNEELVVLKENQKNK